MIIYNTFVGTDCGRDGAYNPGTSDISDYNSCLGYRAGALLAGGDNNVIIGYYAGNFLPNSNA
ncbi:MAG: hypothetical protein HY738_21260 [Bacteroidia bacterium]|nr:hypothetical protein [Bacteroidia bacterium]